MKRITTVITLFLLIWYSYATAAENELVIKKKTFKSESNVEVSAEVGSLLVPENRDNPSSEKIKIYFTKLKSTNTNPAAPIIYLEGGPGTSCSWQAENPGWLERWVPFLELGDVILLDQRGTGAGSERVLYIWPEDIPTDLLSNAEVRKNRSKEMYNRANKAFEERGVDLKGYTTLQNAQDIDALRIALGYQKLSLFGFSYGTHLGQAYLKYFGQHVANAVLVGVEGLNQTYKLPSSMDTHFHKIAMMVANDAELSEQIPDLIALHKSVVQKLDASPVELEINSPLNQQPMKVTIGSYMLNLILRIDIGDASDIPVIPKLLYSIDQGNYSILQWFVQKRIGNFYGIHGMSSTMDPASGASVSRRNQIREEEKNSIFKEVVNPGMDDSGWSIPDLGEEFRKPLISNVRTLFMSGTLDFNTPPYQAEEVRWGFANSNHIVVTNAGHEQILRHPEATNTIIRFLKGKGVSDVTLTNPDIKFIPINKKDDTLWHPSLGEDY